MIEKVEQWLTKTYRQYYQPVHRMGMDDIRLIGGHEKNSNFTVYEHVHLNWTNIIVGPISQRKRKLDDDEEEDDTHRIYLCTWCI